MEGNEQSLLEFFMHPLAIIGLLGQVLFFSRFLVQWIVSERKGESTIPLAFWFLSLGGGALLLTYAIWRKDPIFILGQSVGIIVYTRNLMLIHKRRQPVEEGVSD